MRKNIFIFRINCYLFLICIKEKLFGVPGSEIFDIYGRVVASESGFISMFLDIGIIGVIFYLYFFIKSGSAIILALLILNQKLLDLNM